VGLLSRLFGGGSTAPKSTQAEPIEHKGFTIIAEPIAESGQFRIAGYINKGEGEEQKTHRFIRSDVVASKQDAIELMQNKSKTFIDQMGESIFN
jgi:hypothetical protein